MVPRLRRKGEAKIRRTMGVNIQAERTSKPTGHNQPRSNAVLPRVIAIAE
jgi:hypothetical protein